MCQTTVQIKVHDFVSFSGSFCLPPVAAGSCKRWFRTSLSLPSTPPSAPSQHCIHPQRLPPGESKRERGGARPRPRPSMTSAPYTSSRQTQLHISTAIWPCSGFHAQPTDACVCVGAPVNTSELQLRTSSETDGSFSSDLR